MPPVLPLLAALVATTAPPGAHRPDVPVEAYVTFASAPAFDSATLVRFRGNPIGSGVLVAPRWVLTAAHFTAPLPDGSLSAEVGGRVVAVDSVVTHPHFGSDRPEGVPGVDLALLRLAEPVASLAPAVLHAVPHDGSEIGRVGAIVGFGSVADATARLRDTGGALGRRIGGLNRIDTDDASTYGDRYVWIEPDGQTLYADFDWPAGDAPEDQPLDLEYVPLLGDSGAPLFVETDGVWRLAAITRGAIGPDRNDGLRDRPVYEALAAFTRLAPHRAWLHATVSQP